MSETDDELVKRLRERLTMRYAGDCKCHECQLVNVNDLAEAATRIASLTARVSALEGATGALVAKLDECQRHIGGAFAFMQNHGFTYRGPTYVDELEHARSLIPKP